MKRIICLLIILPFTLFAESDWKRTHYDDEDHMQDLDCSEDGKICFALSRQDDWSVHLYKSTDKGLTWNVRSGDDTKFPFFNAWYGTLVPNSDNYYITWDEGANISKSADGGKTFEHIKLGEGEYSSKVMMRDEKVGMVDTEWFYSITYDGWKTWENVEYDEDGFWWGDIETYEFISDSLILLEDAGSVYKFNVFTKEVITEFRAGKDESTGEFNGITYFDMIDSKLGYGCGGRRNGVGDQQQDLIFKTEDGGENWYIIYDKFNEQSVGGLRQIKFYDKWNGIAVGNYGKVLMTNDGGRNWQLWEDMPEGWFTGGTGITYIDWCGKIPIIATSSGGIYRYDGDFFNFDIEEFFFKRTEERAYCFSKPTFKLDIIEPKGGMYTSQNDVGNVFTPKRAGEGFHKVYYTYTSPQGLTKDTTIFLEVLEEMEIPVIYRSFDTLFTQYDECVWSYNGNDWDTLHVGKYFIPQKEDDYWAMGIGDQECLSFPSELYTFAYLSVDVNKISSIRVVDNNLIIPTEKINSVDYVIIYDLSGRLVLNLRTIQYKNILDLERGIYFYNCYYINRTTPFTSKFLVN
jgi:hypothetical protein